VTTRLAVLALLALLARAAVAVEITECRQVVPRGAVGELRHDLDCTAQPTWPFSAEGVRLERGATLQMNGFVIRGDGTGVGIGCFGAGPQNRCEVNGPGAVSGFEAGINGAGCKLVLRGVLLEGNGDGVLAPLACDLDAENVNAVKNTRSGIMVMRFRARQVIASDNGGVGVLASRIDARSLLAAGNGGEGVRQLTIGGRFGRLIDSTIITNGARAAGYDIAAAGRLRLRSVRCGRSARLRYPPNFTGADEDVEIVGSFGCIHD
jgi:hypothetical protein